MISPETTFLDYMKSADDVRMFSLKEECHNIILEYEKHNIENNVYGIFGEWFLKQVPNGFKLDVSEYQITSLLAQNNIDIPSSYKIKGKSEDYEKCAQLRQISTGMRCGEYETDYIWYTMWQIANAYNCKHGCVVTESPIVSSYNYRNITMSFDWSQSAIDCITRKRWEKDAKRDTGSVFFYTFLGAAFSWCLLMIYVVIFSIFDLSGKTFLIVNFISFIVSIYASISLIRKSNLKHNIKKASADFDKHCEKIANYYVSNFDVTPKRYMGWY